MTNATATAALNRLGTLCRFVPATPGPWFAALREYVTMYMF